VFSRELAYETAAHGYTPLIKGHYSSELDSVIRNHLNDDYVTATKAKTQYKYPSICCCLAARSWLRIVEGLLGGC